jgi:hypothetical protein
VADQIIHGNCWVAYLDILGFKNMLEGHRQVVSNVSEGKRPKHLDLFVKNHYGDILQAVQTRNECCSDIVFPAWFSDSFILFSRDDTLESFAHTASFAGDFFTEAVYREMPLRGALGFGEFYADAQKGIYLGQALVDAHEYAEAQDWIGLIVTPNAHEAYRQLNDARDILSLEGFLLHDVPFNTHRRLFAYRPTDPTRLGSMLTSIYGMQTSAQRDHPREYESKYRQKYERTFAFLKLNAAEVWHRVDPQDGCPDEGV